jgi:hypothetical protein
MSADDSGPVSVVGRGRPLGLCWLVYGIIRLGASVWLLGFMNTATVMFGALLVRVPNPYSLMNAFHLVYAGLIVLSAASGIFGILAGIALLAGMGAGRILALVAAFLSVSEVPVGTTLGIYTLIVFLL